MRVDAMSDAGELSRLTKHGTNGPDVERRGGIPPGWKEPALRPAAAMKPAFGIICEASPTIIIEAVGT
jgi:hypothetical protein